MDLDNNAHSVFLLHYHLVLVVKYRRQVFDDAISGRAKEIFAYIAPNYNITLDIFFLLKSVDCIKVSQLLLAFCTIKHAKFRLCLPCKVISIYKE